MARAEEVKILKYTAVFEPAEEGGYTVIVPALPGCVTKGDNFEEAVEMAKDAISAYLVSLAKHEEFLPEENKESFIGTINVSFPFEEVSPRFAI